jgi:hypothetical protein
VIEGFARHPSVLPGGRLELCVATDAPAFRVEFYRWGAEPVQHGRSPWLEGRRGQRQTLPDGRTGLLRDIVRLDVIPAVARFASAHGLSNPDFLLDLAGDERHLLASADAKFSIETARAKQVSAEVLRALVETGDSPVAAHLPRQRELADGLFLAPDFLLTDAILRGRSGITRLSVPRSQILLVPARSLDLFQEPSLVSQVDAFARLDAYAERWRDDLAYGLYGVRSACAATGCWLDETRPFLAVEEEVTLAPDAVLAEIEERAKRARSGWELLRRWDGDVELIRSQRVAINRMIAPPLPARELRPLVERLAAGAGTEPPSLSYVRRRLATMTRQQLRERFGSLPPPLADPPGTMRAISREMTGIGRELEAALLTIVREGRTASE